MEENNSLILLMAENLDTVNTQMASGYAIIEGGIWNPIVVGEVSWVKQITINTKRGKILEKWLFAGNNTPRNFPKIDKYTKYAVIQIKTISSESASYIKRVVRKATIDAAAGIKNLPKNANFNPQNLIGKEPQAEIIFRTGTSRTLVNAAKDALKSWTKMPEGALLPRVILGLPGFLGKFLKGMGVVGGVASIYFFIEDSKNGNWQGMVGNGTAALSVLIPVGVLAGFGTTTVMSGSAVIGAFLIGWELGTWSDKKTNWSDALSDRALEKREYYQELGLSDTLSTTFSIIELIPIVSKIRRVNKGISRVY